MKLKTRQRGVSLVEMTMVVAGVALLAYLMVPAGRAMLRSFESGTGAKAMINGAMASARALAARHQRYAGIRFQKINTIDDPFKAPQYMIFVIQDPNIGAYMFRAVEGLEPIKLPESVGVMDLLVKTRGGERVIESADDFLDRRVGWPVTFVDTTTFSIIFSPAGKLVIHDVQVRNRDGRIDDDSNDDVFNTQNKVKSGVGMFYQDYYRGLGIDKEPSRNSFVIYDARKFEKLYGGGDTFTAYLTELRDRKIFINPYVGTMISTD